MQNTKAGLLLQNKVLQQMRKIKDAELLKELMHGYIDFILDGNETFDTESDDEKKLLIQFIYIGSIDEIRLSVGRFKKSVEDGKKSLQTLGNGYRESEFKTSRQLTIDKVPEHTREKLKRLISADKEKGLIHFDYDDYYKYCMSNKKKLFISDNFCLSYKGYAKDNKDTPIVVDDIEPTEPKPTPTKQPKFHTLPPVKNKTLDKWRESLEGKIIPITIDGKEHTLDNEMVFDGNVDSKYNFDKETKRLFIENGGEYVTDELRSAFYESNLNSYTDTEYGRFFVESNKVSRFISKGNYELITDKDFIEDIIYSERTKLKPKKDVK